MDRVSGVVFGSLLFCVSLTLCLKIWKKRIRSKVKLPPTVQWKQVGTLKHLHIYPLKAGKPILAEEAECKEDGLHEVPIPGLYPLKDRYFVVYRPDNKKVIMGSTYPLLNFIEIQPDSEDSVIIKYRDKPDLKLTIPTLHETNIRRFRIFSVEYLDCGDEASDWITKVVKGDKNAEGKLRIGYLLGTRKRTENNTTRETDNMYASYMLTTSSSIQDFADKVPEHKIDYRRFRSNFNVESTEKPYAEDNWKWVKIGEDTIFFKTMDCGRCTRINIDPDTGRYNIRREPYTVLKMHRCIKADPKADPIMGIYMELYKAGRIKVGDPVYAAM